MQKRVSILNGAFDALTATETVDCIFRALNAAERGWLCTVNVTTLVMMRKNAELQSFVDGALFVVADGQPLVWCAPLFGGHLPERVAGIDLIDSLCARAEIEGKAVYLLGATAPIVRRAILGLRGRYPKLRVDGGDGYFTESSAHNRVKKIRESGAELLFVGMGSPLQEAFINNHWDDLGVGIAIGVGGSLDVIAGKRFRAPPWMRAIGLEWLVRAAQEPRRLIPRYLSANSKFCLLIANAAMNRLKRRWIMN
jgi:N-acetylglucosaminyldiphosphoundecaprenol N-acetyl-beta-D-mannosaminyltransferase